MLRSLPLVLVVCLLTLPATLADNPRTYDELHDLRVTGANLPTWHAGFGGNCVFFEGNADAVTGEAIAIWAPQTPLVEELEIVMLHILENGEEYHRVTGSSPLVLSFEDLPFTQQETGAFSALVGVQIPASADGVAVNQRVNLDLAFDYVAEEALQEGGGGCTIG